MQECELDWLVETYIPPRIEKLLQLIRTAIATCSINKGSLTVPSNIFPGATLALTTPNDDVKGFVTINGHEITKADIQLKVANKLQRFVIGKTITLTQILDCRNYLKEAEVLCQAEDSMSQMACNVFTALSKAKRQIIESVQKADCHFEDMEAAFYIENGNLCFMANCKKKIVLVETIIPSIATVLTILDYSIEIIADVKKKLELFTNK